MNYRTKMILKRVGEVALSIALIVGFAYLMVEWATGPCVVASYCDKINAK